MEKRPKQPKRVKRASAVGGVRHYRLQAQPERAQATTNQWLAKDLREPERVPYGLTGKGTTEMASKNGVRTQEHYLHFSDVS